MKAIWLIIVLIKENYRYLRKCYLKQQKSQKRVAYSKVKEKKLYLSLSFIFQDWFCANLLNIWYKLSNKIRITISINRCVTSFDLINKIFFEIICYKFEIRSQCLTKHKFIQEFDCKSAKCITYIINLIFFINRNIKRLAQSLMTLLVSQSIIFSHSWMKILGVFIDIINNFILICLNIVSILKVLYLLYFKDQT